MSRYQPYTSQFDGKAIKDLEKLDGEINEELKKPGMDCDKINRLRMEKLLTGMQAGNAYWTKTNIIPW